MSCYKVDQAAIRHRKRPLELFSSTSGFIFTAVESVQHIISADRSGHSRKKIPQKGKTTMKKQNMKFVVAVLVQVLSLQAGFHLIYPLSMWSHQILIYE